jgi:dienelactone hydrolase
MCALSLLDPSSRARETNAQADQQYVEVNGRNVKYEIFGPPQATAFVIFLHGSSGPEAYESEAKKFATCQTDVVLLHYFDATGSRFPSDTNYQAWVWAVAQTISVLRHQQALARVTLMGVSLGASVALAAGSQQTGADAVIDWYGSLPDYFFHRLKGMPPLLILHGARDMNIPVLNAQQLQKLCSILRVTCRSHFYPDQGHGFMGADLVDAERRSRDFLVEHGGARCAD